MDVLDAGTQGMIGYLIQQELRSLLPPQTQVATLLTMILVDPDDPAFASPTKFVGPVYPRAAADRLAAQEGWQFRPDGDSWRRVVPSPQPQQILEIAPITWLLERGAVVICAGGGGIPTMYPASGSGELAGVEAVIDKDLAGELLAEDVSADLYLMATDVDGVYLGWGTPEQRLLSQVTPEELASHQFAAGSMGPKVEAAARFAAKTGGRAAIGSLADIAGIVAGRPRDRTWPRAWGPDWPEHASAPASGCAGGGRAVGTTLSADRVLQAERVDEQRGAQCGRGGTARQRSARTRFAEARPEPTWRRFVRQYQDLMQIVLLAAAIASFWPVKEYGTGLVLIVITVFNALLGMQQEGKAAAAVAALSRMMIVKAKVRRAGTLRELPAEELVPGDVVAVEAGDVIPADGRIIAAASLEIDESALTGESLPVPKETDPVAGVDTPLADRVDMAYMNTSVTRGSATVVVTATGMDTEVGHISGLLQGQEQTKTPLTRQLDTLTSQILTIAGVALVASLGMNLARGRTLKEVFAASIAFAVAAIPEELPAVVTAILSRGTQMLAGAGAIMKQLRSAETLGSTSAINSDKTGTLTLNQMTAVQLSLPDRRYRVSGSGYATDGADHPGGGRERRSPSTPFLMPMVLGVGRLSCHRREPDRRPDRGRTGRAGR